MVWLDKFLLEILIRMQLKKQANLLNFFQKVLKAL